MLTLLAHELRCSSLPAGNNPLCSRVWSLPIDGWSTADATKSWPDATRLSGKACPYLKEHGPAAFAQVRSLTSVLRRRSRRGDSNPQPPFTRHSERISLRISAFRPVLTEHEYGSRCCCSLSVDAGQARTFGAHECAHTRGFGSLACVVTNHSSDPGISGSEVLPESRDARCLQRQQR